MNSSIKFCSNSSFISYRRIKFVECGYSKHHKMNYQTSWLLFKACLCQYNAVIIYTTSCYMFLVIATYQFLVVSGV